MGKDSRRRSLCGGSGNRQSVRSQIQISRNRDHESANNHNKPTSQPLYITGTATTGGTDLNAAEKITELSNGRLYNWRGQLKQGGFKFITTLGQALPSYNKGADNSSVVKRTSETEADDLFQINEAGLYYIYLSLKDMTISYKFSYRSFLYEIVISLSDR